VAPPTPALALSDIVRLCGMESAVTTGDAVRFEPDLGERVAGDRPLTVYFEIDHLALEAGDASRFSYRYGLTRIETRDERPIRPRVGVFEAGREESHVGPLRRQFVTVPIRGLKPGVYELEIEVRDLIADRATSARTRFTRD
jgi:hypothetical protein